MKTFKQYIEIANIEKRDTSFIEGKMTGGSIMHREIFMEIVKKLDSAVKDIESLPEIYAIQFKMEAAKLKEMSGNFRYLTGL